MSPGLYRVPDACPITRDGEKSWRDARQTLRTTAALAITEATSPPAGTPRDMPARPSNSAAVPRIPRAPRVAAQQPLELPRLSGGGLAVENRVHQFGEFVGFMSVPGGDP